MELLLHTLGIRINLPAYFAIWALVFVRIFMVFLLTPFLGTQAVLGQARVVASMAVSLFVTILMGPSLLDQVPSSYVVLFGLFVKELLFGFVIGFVTMATFHAFEAAGSVVDHQRGSANAQLFLPQLGQVSIFGLFNFWLAIAFFLSVGGHRFFLEAFFMSYQTVPILSFPDLAPGFSPFLQLIVRMSGDVLIIAAQLSAPVLIAILLVDIVLGIANKMAPQINVFELGFALKGYIGPLMIYVSIIVLVSQMDFFTKVMVKTVYDLSRLLGG